MTVYLDTSVVLRVLLREAGRLAGWGQWDRSFSSELLGLEARRVMDRLRIAGTLQDADLADLHRQLTIVEETVGMVALTRTVLRRAALPMATPVRTLDAIHLTTALMLRERAHQPVVFATHDSQQATAARALGFEVVGVR